MNPSPAAESCGRVSGQHAGPPCFPIGKKPEANSMGVLDPRTFVTQCGQRELLFKSSAGLCNLRVSYSSAPRLFFTIGKSQDK